MSRNASRVPSDEGLEKEDGPRGFGSELKDMVALAGAASGVLGALVYVALTFVCARLYQPLGVSPDAVGLGYGALLARAAAGAVGIVVTLGGIGGCIWLVMQATFGEGTARSLPNWAFGVGGVAVGLLIGLSTVIVAPEPFVLTYQVAFMVLIIGFFAERRLQWRPGSRFTWLGSHYARVVSAALWLGIASMIALGVQAEGDKGRMEKGRRPEALVFGVPPPWAAEVVRINWASEKPINKPSLPRCLLYLGAAGGLSSFYDPTPGMERTLRLPTSMVLVEVLADEDSARPPKDSRGACS